MLNFIAGFIVGALACPAIITYHNWRAGRGGDK